MSKQTNYLKTTPSFISTSAEELLRMDSHTVNNQEKTALDKLCMASTEELYKAHAYFSKTTQQLDTSFHLQHSKSNSDWTTILSRLTSTSITSGAVNNIVNNKAEIDKKMVKLVNALKSSKLEKLEKVYENKALSFAQRKYHQPIIASLKDDNDISKCHSLYFSQLCCQGQLINQ